jgi:hypothetical protein
VVAVSFDEPTVNFVPVGSEVIGVDAL